MYSFASSDSKLDRMESARLTAGRASLKIQGETRGKKLHSVMAALNPSSPCCAYFANSVSANLRLSGFLEGVSC